MKDKFALLLTDIGENLDLDLFVDQHQSCTILVDDRLEVQIELDDSENNLLILGYICKVPPGKFRENVLMQALKQNDKKDRLVDFAYSDTTNQLIFFKYLPLDLYTPNKITDYLGGITLLNIIAWFIYYI